MTLPNFFIVGAPKSGTTALYYHLRNHPDIFMPAEKEPHYFSSDIDFKSQAEKTLDWYRDLFSKASGQPMVGESSVWYLYSSQAAAGIRETCPDSQIIAILRNPTDMVYSYHSQRLFNETENLLSFKKAWDASPFRRKGQHLPDNPYPTVCLDYCNIAAYGTQLERYVQTFGREKIKILLFDDWKRNSAAVCHEAFEFLNVRADVVPEVSDSYAIRNPNRRARSEALMRQLRNPTGVTRRVARAVIPPRFRDMARKMLVYFNTRPQKREEMDPGLRRVIDAHYRPEVEKLSELMDRDMVQYWSRD